MTRPFRVLACGSRHLRDYPFVARRLDSLLAYRLPNVELIHGGCRGADELAGRWAAGKGLPVKVFPAAWEEHGRAAGPIRNCEMIDALWPPDSGLSAVVAFRLHCGRGTADMIKRAEEAGFPVAIVDVQTDAAGLVRWYARYNLNWAGRGHDWKPALDTYPGDPRVR